MMNRIVKARILAVVAGAALAASACGSPDVGSRIPRASVSSATTEPPLVTAPATTGKSVGAAPADLHDVDWERVPVPGDFCGIPGLVTFKRLRLAGFKGGEATATSRTWGPVHLFRRDEVMVYGDIEGDQRSEAAVSVVCDNGGGTAAGQLAFAYMVFEGVQGRLIAIGTVTPQKNPPHVHVTLLSELQMTRGRLTAHENWYRPMDPNCCPTGKAETIWTVKDGHLTPGAPHITS
jgi:hypothetical protein